MSDTRTICWAYCEIDPLWEYRMSFTFRKFAFSMVTIPRRGRL
jgi:hypothetical protein